MSFLRQLRSTPVKLCAVVVGASLLMGQGCPPTDGGAARPSRRSVSLSARRIAGSATAAYMTRGRRRPTPARSRPSRRSGRARTRTASAAIRSDTAKRAAIRRRRKRRSSRACSARTATARAWTTAAMEMSRRCGLDVDCRDGLRQLPYGFHHPTYDEWHSTNHSRVEPDVAASLTQGRSATVAASATRAIIARSGSSRQHERAGYAVGGRRAG